MLDLQCLFESVCCVHVFKCKRTSLSLDSSSLLYFVNNFSVASEILQVPTIMHRIRSTYEFRETQDVNKTKMFDSSDRLGFLELGMVFSSIIVPMRDVLFSQRFVATNIYGRVP